MKAVIAVGLLLTGSVATAQDDDIVKKAINQPGVNYTVYGASQTNKAVKDKEVVGGHALRVVVSAKGPETYSTGANAPLTKPIVQGHRIAVAFWARAPKLTGDETTPIPFYGIVGGPPSYTAVVSGTAAVGATWKLYNTSGKAPADMAAGAATMAVHLGAAATTIDLGPVFVIDLDATP